MKIDQLNYFLEVAKLEHLGKAAKILSISPSAISHSIALLEEELGQDLFFRERQRIFLTPEGKILQQRVSEILLKLQCLKEELSHESAPLQGHFRLGVNSSLAEPLIAAWNKVSENNPNLTGEIFSLRSGDVLTGVLDGELDFGLCFSPEASERLDKVILKKGQLTIAVRKKHPVLISKKSLNDFPSLAPKALKGIENCERHPLLKRLGIHSPVKTIFDNYGIALSLIKSSNAWALLPDFLIEQNKNDIQAAVETSSQAPYNVSAVWLNERPLLKPLKLMLENLRAHGF